MNFLRREVTVTQQLISPTAGRPCIGPPKTKTSVRTVELPAFVAEALSEHIKRHPPVEVEIEDRTDPRNVHTRTATLLFTTSREQPLARWQWKEAWQAARDAAGLSKGTGVHALRHLYASALIEGGASVKQVQMAMGHSEPGITLKTYTHLWPDSEGRTRNIMDKAFRAQDQTSSASSVQ